MAKTSSSDFEKAVKIRLIEMDKDQKWLIEGVSRRTGLYFDSGYLWKVLNGILKPPKIIDAICDILDISVPEQQTEKQDNKEVK